MKFRFLILSVIFIGILYSDAIGQINLEKKFDKLTNDFNTKNKVLDSLEIVLEQKIRIIETEKLNADKDKTKLAELLANTAGLTNKIDETQSEIDNIANKLESTKEALHLFYSKQIDSLKSSDKKNQNNQVEIIKLIEKRLLVAPKINILSFSPNSVIDIKKAKDSVEQKIFTEYLTEAYSEIEIKLYEIEKLRLEIKNMIALNEETKEFLEDIDFDNNYAVFSNPQSTTEGSKASVSDEFTYNDRSPELNTLNSQSKTFSDLLFQFGISSNLTSNFYENQEGSTAKQNLQEFNQLIEIVEKQLLDYKTVIKNKLGSAKVK